MPNIKPISRSEALRLLTRGIYVWALLRVPGKKNLYGIDRIHRIGKHHIHGKRGIYRLDQIRRYYNRPHW